MTSRLSKARGEARPRIAACLSADDGACRDYVLSHTKPDTPDAGRRKCAVNPDRRGTVKEKCDCRERALNIRIGVDFSRDAGDKYCSGIQRWCARDTPLRTYDSSKLTLASVPPASAPWNPSSNVTAALRNVRRKSSRPWLPSTINMLRNIYR